MRPKSAVPPTTMLHSIPGPPHDLRHLAEMWDGFYLENRSKITNILIDRIVAGVEASEAADTDATNKLTDDECQATRDRRLSESSPLDSSIDEAETYLL